MNYKVYSWATLSLSALLMFSACANDDIANSENEVTLNGHKLNITINEETFEAEKPTRAAQVVHRDTIDMGDGLIAEVSIEPDKTAPTPQPAKTRAAMSEGHYTIYAVDAAGNRVADELSGTVSNGKFIPDANAMIRLDPGTYTFVCHNDAFTKTATGLDLKGDMYHGFKDCPMMGTVTKTLSGGVETVAFNMKHLAARTRVQITTYTSYPKMIEGTTAFIGAGNHDFSTMHFDMTGNLTSRDVGVTAYTWDTFDKYKHVGNKPFSSIVEPFETISSQYTYIALAEGENIPANSLYFHIHGSFYGKTKQPYFAINTPLERNHTYLVKLTMKTKDPLYLYQDGTVGYLGDKETRTPIGIVLTEKTSATDKGLAVALKNADNNRRFFVGYGYYFNGLKDDGTATDNMKGYEYTWTTDYLNPLYRGVAKTWRTLPPAEKEPDISGDDFVAYQAAGNYTTEPDVKITGTNIGKWFLPSTGQWRLLLEKLGGLNVSTVPASIWADASWHKPFVTSTDPTWNGIKAQSYFTQAGGSLDFDVYCLSGSSSDTSSFYLDLSTTNISFGNSIFANPGLGTNGFVRPFVYF